MCDVASKKRSWGSASASYHSFRNLSSLKSSLVANLMAGGNTAGLSFSMRILRGGLVAFCRLQDANLQKQLPNEYILYCFSLSESETSVFSLL